MPLFICMEWQCEIQDSEMVVIRQLCSLRRSVPCQETVVLYLPVLSSAVCWYSTKNLNNVRRRSHLSNTYRGCVLTAIMSSLTRPAVSHVRYAYGGLLRSPRQSLQLATLLRLITVNLELMTLSEGRQRLRGDLINNDLRHSSFLQGERR